MRRACRYLDTVIYTDRDQTYLGVVCILGSIVKGSGSEMVLLPRSRNALLICGCRGSSDMLVSFGEMCRLHGRGDGAR